MANAIEKLAFKLAEPVASQQGVDLIDISYKKEGSDWYLRVFIDKKGGIGIDECEVFSRGFGEILDQEDPIEENYCLEVSSPGVDRKLEKEREFLYYRGREVDVKLYQAIEGKKEFTGILKDYKDNTAVIEAFGQTVEIPKKQAVYIRLHFAF